jgi:hypothetical protein
MLESDGKCGPFALGFNHVAAVIYAAMPGMVRGAPPREVILRGEAC